MKRPLILFSGLLMILLLVWSQRSAPSTEVSRTALIMGTLVEIKVVGTERDVLEKAISAAFSAMRREEERFSTRLATSQISAINRTETALEVDPQVIELLRLGQSITRASEGAFNMGLGALKKLWDFAESEQGVPAAAAINALLFDASQAVVAIDGRQVARRSERVVLDLGGIAKGYAVDQALEVLRSAGLESASINAGGDIGLVGGHGARPWRIGIQHPRKAEQLLATIELRGRALVTSGDYERFFIRDGIRYHHIFDPRTGRPATASQSVSVVANSVAEADALATAAFVLGSERGLQLLEELPEVDGLIVSSSGEVAVTSGLKDQIQWR